MRFIEMPGASSVELPPSIRTRSGVLFNPQDTLWSYRDGVNLIRLNFDQIHAPLRICQSLKLVLAWYAENQSPSHLGNLFDRFRHFVSKIRLTSDTISSSDLINYRATLDRQTEWYLGSLSGLLKRWHRMSFPGVSDDAAKYLRSIRIRGNPKGVAVRTMDPEQGRFTDVEFEAIRTALNQAHELHSIDQEDYVLTLLFMALGPRPIQYAAMKVCDITSLSTGSGTTYVIAVPRAKKREQDGRSSFKKRTLTPAIGKLVLEHAVEVRNRFASLLQDPQQAPLFPAKRRLKRESPGFEYHRTAGSLSEWFQVTMDRLMVRSERTGKSMNINATRFRRTLACRAADEGHGELVIAELLDHTDTQNAGVYVEATPGMMERIDRAVALKLAPLAQAFAGVIITDESQARRSGDPSSRIRDPRLDPKPVGNCGEYGFCGLMAPIACYTCRSFEPWLDGPHEAVLDHLIKERERLYSSSDRRIASIDDRTILAVAEVVRRCADITGGKQEHPNE
ncbi:MAG TPA: site-specific integrase [Terriglobales bacterium]|nr:site-specific integrase [Terriglobales bacterium]